MPQSSKAPSAKESEKRKKAGAQFIKVPMHVLAEERISSTEKLLLGFLISLEVQRGYSFANNLYLADYLACKPATITKGLSNLKKFNFIDITYPRSFRRQIRIKEWVLTKKQEIEEVEESSS